MICGIYSQTGPNEVKQAKQGKIGPDGVKQCKTRSNMDKWGQIGSNGGWWVAILGLVGDHQLQLSPGVSFVPNSGFVVHFLLVVDHP